ncbi:hypothetical protein F5Y19DRAFT_471600 [Xylariaceae sp. FL1651]|nr:hypothetical protein F5Y19DRAFT_471600 [Xylariaceae sp. FL1651]
MTLSLPTLPSVGKSFDYLFGCASFMWDAQDLWIPPILRPATLVHDRTSCDNFHDNTILRKCAFASPRQHVTYQGGGTQKYYAVAVSEWTLYDEGSKDVQKRNDTVPSRGPVLTTLFLGYTDLLQGQIEGFHANLKTAYDIYRSLRGAQFRSVEVCLLSWLRLLDARAISTGGQGLVLSENDEKLLSSAPGSFKSGDLGSELEVDIEEELFDILYQPGIVFFQRVQRFMGCISQQDPWH